MIASFHLIRYPRRRAPTRGRSAQNVDGLVFWRRLGTGPDFLALGSDASFASMAKTLFRRWGFFGVWEDERSLELFLGDSPIARRWHVEAAETWHVWLQPTRVTGTWQGGPQLDGFEPGDPPKAPAAVLTRAHVRLRKQPTFFGWAAPTAVPALWQTPGFIAGVAVDRPPAEVGTFSLWRSSDDALGFAYRRPGHSAVLERNRRERIMAWFFAAHFYPYRSVGMWGGRDPLA